MHPQHFFETLENKELWIRRCKFAFLHRLHVPTTLMSLICLISTNDPIEKMYFNDLFEKSLDLLEEPQIIPSDSIFFEWRNKIDEEFYKYLSNLFGKTSFKSISSNSNFLESDADSDVDFMEENPLESDQNIIRRPVIHPLLQVSQQSILPIVSSSQLVIENEENLEDASAEEEDETLSTHTTSSITSTTVSTTSSVFNNAPSSPRTTSTIQPISNTNNSSTLPIPIDITNSLPMVDTILMNQQIPIANVEQLNLSNRQLFHSNLSLRLTNQFVQWSGFVHPVFIYSSLANLLRKKEDDEENVSMELNNFVIKTLLNILPLYKSTSVYQMIRNFISLSYHEIGYVHAVSRRDFSQGLAYYEKAMLFDKNNAIHYCNRAVAYRELHQNRKALQDFHTAEILDPKHKTLYFSRGLLYKRQLYDDRRALIEYICSYQSYEEVFEQKSKLKHKTDEESLLNYYNIISVPNFWYNGYVRCASIFMDWNETYLAQRNYNIAEDKSGKVFLNKGISDAMNGDLDEAQASLMFFYFHH